MRDVAGQQRTLTRPRGARQPRRTLPGCGGRSRLRESPGHRFRLPLPTLLPTGSRNGRDEQVVRGSAAPRLENDLGFRVFQLRGGVKITSRACAPGLHASPRLCLPTSPLSKAGDARASLTGFNTDPAPRGSQSTDLGIGVSGGRVRAVLRLQTPPAWSPRDTPRGSPMREEPSVLSCHQKQFSWCIGLEPASLSKPTDPNKFTAQRKLRSEIIMSFF